MIEGGREDEEGRVREDEEERGAGGDLMKNKWREGR